MKKIDTRSTGTRVLKRMNTVHLFHNAVSMIKHEVPEGFPERPERLAAVTAALKTSGLWSACQPTSIDAVSEDIFVKHYGAEEVF